MTSSTVAKVFVCTLIAFASILGSSTRAEAASISLPINAPSFLIPIGGKSGVLDVFANGSATASGGFNALGNQTTTVAGGGTSSGTLLLNFHFTGFPLGDPDWAITEAILRMSVYDLDFQTDYITQKVKLQETATITSAGGLAIQLNLKDYLPAPGTPTDDKTINLKPIQLVPSYLPPGYFADPFHSVHPDERSSVEHGLTVGHAGQHSRADHGEAQDGRHDRTRADHPASA